MSDSEYESLLNSSNRDRVAFQNRAHELLFQGFDTLSAGRHATAEADPKIVQLRQQLDDATEIFVPNEVQKEIYGNDTGTALVPRLFRRLLVEVRFSFVVRPVTIEDARRFMEWAYQNRIHYTIRGAGTWPLGGCLPLEGARILDLSYLDFVDIDEAAQIITVGPGVVFSTLRKLLKERGLALRQDITNPNSGTFWAGSRLAVSASARSSTVT